MQHALLDRLQADFEKVAAPYVKRLGLRIVEIGADRVVLAMPVTGEVVHGGGVLCGQAILAAADTAMVIAVSAALGGFKPMTTVQLQTTFVRPVPGDAREVRITCTLLRSGKRLSFGDIRIATPDGELAAHATTTYALL
jgi:uncharacterized protein (TIGR00369 family)